MQYVIYFLVATPMVLGWLLWASATTPPQAPLISPTGLNAIAAEAPAGVPANPAAQPATKALAANSGKAAGPASDKKG